MADCPPPTPRSGPGLARQRGHPEHAIETRPAAGPVFRAAPHLPVSATSCACRPRVADVILWWLGKSVARGRLHVVWRPPLGGNDVPLLRTRPAPTLTGRAPHASCTGPHRTPALSRTPSSHDFAHTSPYAACCCGTSMVRTLQDYQARPHPSLSPLWNLRPAV